MTMLRRLNIALLAVLLVLTGQAMAFARGQAPSEGQMVLCTAHGTVVVYTDSEGQPTSPPQLCADALHTLSVPDTVSVDLVELVSGFVTVNALATRDLIARTPMPRAPARGPPVL